MSGRPEKAGPAKAKADTPKDTQQPKSAHPVRKKPPVRHNKPEIEYNTESEGETDSRSSSESESPKSPSSDEPTPADAAPSTSSDTEVGPTTIPITEAGNAADVSSGNLDADETVEEDLNPKSKKGTKNRDPFEEYLINPVYEHNVIAPTSGWPAFWGAIPLPGQEPRPDRPQPPARSTNANTDPPLWEHQHDKFEKGVEAHERLVLKLMDQRFTAESDPSCKSGPKKKSYSGAADEPTPDPTPSQKPEIYFYEHGEPKDWSDSVLVKTLNDFHRDAIKRLTMDPPCTDLERREMKRICCETPKASIWEIGELFNDRFIGDFTYEEAFEGDELSGGRPIESIRHEYLTNRESYENKDEDDHPDAGSLEKQINRTRAVRKHNMRQLTYRETIFKASKKGVARPGKNTKADLENELYELAVVSDEDSAEEASSSSRRRKKVIS